MPSRQAALSLFQPDEGNENENERDMEAADGQELQTNPLDVACRREPGLVCREPESRPRGPGLMDYRGGSDKFKKQPNCFCFLPFSSSCKSWEYGWFVDFQSYENCVMCFFSIRYVCSKISVHENNEETNPNHLVLHIVSAATLSVWLGFFFGMMTLCVTTIDMIAVEYFFILYRNIVD